MHTGLKLGLAARRRGGGGDAFSAYTVGATSPALIFDAEAGRYLIDADLAYQEQFPNPNFDGDLSGWSNENDYWSYSAGTAVHASGSVFNKLMGAVPSELIGETVRIKLVVDSYSGTSGLRVQWRNSDGSANDGIYTSVAASPESAITSAGTYEIDVVVPSGAAFLALARDASGQSMAATVSEFSLSTIAQQQATLTLSDFIATGSGGRYIDFSRAAGMADYTVSVDVVVDNDSGTPSGNIFSSTSGSSYNGDRIEMPFDSLTYGEFPRLYLDPGDPSADFSSLPSVSKATDSGATRLNKERLRVTFTVEAGGSPKMLVNNYELRTASFVYGTTETPSRFGVGCRVGTGGAPSGDAVDVDVRRVVVWPSVLSDAEMLEYNTTGAASPIHLVGDSFLNLQAPLSELNTLIAADGKYVALSQDHVGGSTMTQSATRFLAGPTKYRDATLVICDFGFEGTSADAITAINSMVAALSHDRWVYMQAAPSAAQTPPVTATPQKYLDLLAEYGTDHVASTLAEAWAESDGSPEDEALIADGMWPLSLRTSNSDFHPSYPLGANFVARQIKAALEARGWL
jgi:hypothetical protein